MKQRNQHIILILLISILLAGCKKQDAGTIEENFYIKNDGAEMPVFVRGNANASRILVVIHGGPGGSSLNHYYQVPEFTEAMEGKYLLVYWEQRGSGISSGTLNDGDFTLEKMSEDLDKLLHVIAHKYGKDKKLFLFGQSFGSILSGKFVSSQHANDHNLSGWITSGGMYSFKDYVPFLRSYIEPFLNQQTNPAWNDVKAKMNAITGNTSTLESISKWNELGYEMQQIAVELGQANPRQTSNLPGIFTPGFYNPIAALVNKENANTNILNDIIDNSLKNELMQANVPALFFHGGHDFVTPRNYGDSLMEFYGHSDKQHIVFPKGKHNVIATNPSESIQYMIEFMDSH